MKYLVLYWSHDDEKWCIYWYGTRMREAREMFKKCSLSDDVRLFSVTTLMNAVDQL